MWNPKYIFEMQKSLMTASSTQETTREEIIHKPKEPEIEIVNQIPARNIISFPLGTKLIRQGSLSTCRNEQQFNNYMQRELLQNNDTNKPESNINSINQGQECSDLSRKNYSKLDVTEDYKDHISDVSFAPLFPRENTRISDGAHDLWGIHNAHQNPIDNSRYLKGEENISDECFEKYSLKNIVDRYGHNHRNADFYKSSYWSEKENVDNVNTFRPDQNYAVSKIEINEADRYSSYINSSTASIDDYNRAIGSQKKSAPENLANPSMQCLSEYEYPEELYEPALTSIESQWNNLSINRVQKELHIKSENLQQQKHNSPNIQSCDITTTTQEKASTRYDTSHYQGILNQPAGTLNQKTCYQEERKKVSDRSRLEDTNKNLNHKEASVVCKLQVKVKGPNSCFMCNFSSEHLPTFIAHMGKCIVMNSDNSKRSTTTSNENENNSQRQIIHSLDSNAKDEPNENSEVFDETTNSNLKIKLKKKTKKQFQGIVTEPSWITVPNNVDFQCPYCLRLFHTELKMTRHIEKCAQLRSLNIANKGNKCAAPVISTKETDTELNNEVAILSSIYSKRKSYIKALKSLKEDEEVISKKSLPKQPAKENCAKAVTRQKSATTANKSSDIDTGLNGIFTCSECKYVTYRKWDLDRHFNEKHSSYENSL